MLNERQGIALRQDHHTYIEAAPGTGKTRLVAAKVERELTAARELGRGIACVTYTNAARDEIANRLDGSLTSEERAVVQISTVHGFCMTSIIDPSSIRLGFQRSAKIAARNMPHYIAALEMAARTATIELGFAVSVQRISALLAEIAWRDASGSPLRRGGVPFSGYDEKVLHVFWSELKQLGCLDYVTVFFESLRALDDDSFMHCFTSRYAWIIVDEYQDSNIQQLMLLRRIAASGRVRLFLVGDQNQSIYGFGGASPIESAAFAAEIGAKRCFLTDTHRLPAQIAKHCDYVFPRALRPSGEAARINGVVSFADGDVITAVLGQFIPLCEQLNIEPSGAAVLCARNSIVENLAASLRAQNIPVFIQKSSTQETTAWFELLIEMILVGAMANNGSERARATVHLSNFLDQFDIVPEDAEVQLALADALSTALIRVGRQISNDLSVDVQIAVILGVLKDGLTNCACFPALLAWDKVRSFLALAWASLRATGFTNRSVGDVVASLRPQSTLRAMSIHTAKGQQFEAVALVGFDAGILPDFRSDTSIELWEDLRKLYVAISRPKQLLWIQSSAGKTSSPFLPIAKGKVDAYSVIGDSAKQF
jgi:DNA helicase II / ATP-dependent DNA helicase PcrA